MIYNVVLVSGEQQNDLVIHIHIALLFQILFPFRLLQDIEQSSLCYTVGLCWLSVFYFIFLYLFIFFVFFLAVLGLSCGMWDLSLWCAGSLLQHVGFFLVVAFGFSLSSCGTWVPERVGSVVVARA